MTSGTWISDAPVLCAGHQRVLVVGSINHYRRHWRSVIDLDPEQITDPWMPPLSAIKKDSSNPGAAIVEGEGAHAGIVTWVDKLGQDVKIRPLRLASLGDWRKVAPYKAAAALVTLMREIKVLGQAECQKLGWWTTKCPDGQYRPCEAGVIPRSSDLVRWGHAWRHGKDPHADTKLVTTKDFKRIAERVSDLDSMLDEVDRISP